MAIAASTLSREDVAAIERLINEAVQRARAGDWAGYAALHAEDAVLHPPGGPVVSGRKAVQEWGDTFPPIDHAQLSDIRIAGEGNLAYCTCAYRLTVRGASPEEGKELIVFRRGTNGWEVVAGSFNTTAPA